MYHRHVCFREELSGAFLLSPPGTYLFDLRPRAHYHIVLSERRSELNHFLLAFSNDAMKSRPTPRRKWTGSESVVSAPEICIRRARTAGVTSRIRRVHRCAAATFAAYKHTVSIAIVRSDLALTPVADALKRNDYIRCRALMSATRNTAVPDGWKWSCTVSENVIGRTADVMLFFDPFVWLTVFVAPMITIFTLEPPSDTLLTFTTTQSVSHRTPL